MIQSSFKSEGGKASIGLPMAVDESGKRLTEALRLGVDLHLAREMLPLRIGDRLFTLTQEGARSRLSFLRDD